MRKRILNMAMAMMVFATATVVAQDNTNVITKVKESTTQAAEKVGDAAKNATAQTKEFGKEVKEKAANEGRRAKRAIKGEGKKFDKGRHKTKCCVDNAGKAGKSRKGCTTGKQCDKAANCTTTKCKDVKICDKVKSVCADSTNCRKNCRPN